MNNFVIDKQLQKDCITLGKFDLCHLLLMNNSQVPWFILVPETDKTELHELDHSTQLQLLSEINVVSKFIQSEYKPDKLNTAAIGNIVRQLHIHIIGRNFSDICWPKPVWGNIDNSPYTIDEMQRIKHQILKQINTLKP